MSLDCLLINLTRFGDIIQSQALVHDLTGMGLRTGLLCQQNFAKTGMILDGLSGVFALPGAALLKGVDTDWRDAYRCIRSFAEEIRKEGARYIVNATPLASARLLARLAGPTDRQPVGFGIDSEGFGVNNGPWSSLLVASSMCRENAVFNVTDLFRNLARPLGEPVEKNADIRCRKAGIEDREHAEALLAVIERDEARKGAPIRGFVAFQLGASSEARQWPADHFAVLGDRLWEEAGLCPVLTGAKSEMHLAYEYAKHGHGPYVMAIGKTDLGTLSALLCRVRLLVSNDTGTLHLASALETRSVSFFLATAQPWDTGPALTGCLCLEPDLPCHPCAFSRPCDRSHACRRTIGPEPVARAILAWLSGASWSESLADVHSANARFWETERDEKGRATVHERGETKARDRTQWNHLQRAFWSHLLDRPDDADDFTKSLSLENPLLCRTLSQEIGQATTILKALEAQTLLLGKSAAAGSLVLRNSDRLQTHLLTSRHLRSFGHYWSECRQMMSRSVTELCDGIRNLRTHMEVLEGTLRSGTKDAS